MAGGKLYLNLLDIAGFLFYRVGDSLRISAKVVVDDIEIPSGQSPVFDGVDLSGSISVVRPIGVLVFDPDFDEIFRSTNATTPQYVQVTNTGGGGGGNALKDANISAQIDGVKTDFLVPEPYLPGTLWVWWQGQKQLRGVTYTETGAVSFQTTFVPKVGEYVEVAWQAP